MSETRVIDVSRASRLDLEIGDRVSIYSLNDGRLGISVTGSHIGVMTVAEASQLVDNILDAMCDARDKYLTD